jgi:hypothetical protein
MKKITCLTFILIYTFSFSQKICVVDSLSKKPLPYTNAKFYLANKITGGDYCNVKGEIIFDKINFDNVEFSQIGYDKKIISKAIIKDSIFLKQNIIRLNEIKIVKNKKKEVSSLGYIDYKKKIRLSAYKGFEMVVYIANPFKQPKDIQSFLFKVKKDEKFKTAVRIHFYKKDLEKLIPGEEILNENIIQYIDGEIKELFEVDVSKYELELPIEGAFIGIEWLGILDEKSGELRIDKNNWDATYIDLNDKINQPLTFMRSKFRNPTWENTVKMKNESKKYIEYKNYPNASFGIKILK